MKIKKLVLSVCFAACIAVAIFMTGCGQHNSDTEDTETYTVTVIGMMRNNPRERYTYYLTVDEGDYVTTDLLYEAYPDSTFIHDPGLFFDEQLYIDDECNIKYESVVDGDMTLYFYSYESDYYGRVIFDYNGKQYVIYRPANNTPIAADFSHYAYGIGNGTDYAFYSDEARTTLLDLKDVEVKCALDGDTVIYVDDFEPDHVVTVHSVGSSIDYKLNVKTGDTVTEEDLYRAYKYDNEFLPVGGGGLHATLYTDPECRTKFVGVVDHDITLYIAGIIGEIQYAHVTFHYNGNRYVIHRFIGSTLTAEDFSRSAYGFGNATDYVFYSDEARTSLLDIESVELTPDYPYTPVFIDIYVGDFE